MADWDDFGDGGFGDLGSNDGWVDFQAPASTEATPSTTDNKTDAKDKTNANTPKSNSKKKPSAQGNSSAGKKAQSGKGSGRKTKKDAVAAKPISPRAESTTPNPSGFTDLDAASFDFNADHDFDEAGFELPQSAFGFDDSFGDSFGATETPKATTPSTQNKASPSTTGSAKSDKGKKSGSGAQSARNGKAKPSPLSQGSTPPKAGSDKPDKKDAPAPKGMTDANTNAADKPSTPVNNSKSAKTKQSSASKPPPANKSTKGSKAKVQQQQEEEEAAEDKKASRDADGDAETTPRIARLKPPTSPPAPGLTDAATDSTDSHGDSTTPVRAVGRAAHRYDTASQEEQKQRRDEEEAGAQPPSPKPRGHIRGASGSGVLGRESVASMSINATPAELDRAAMAANTAEERCALWRQWHDFETSSEYTVLSRAGFRDALLESGAVEHTISQSLFDAPTSPEELADQLGPILVETIAGSQEDHRRLIATIHSIRICARDSAGSLPLDQNTYVLGLESVLAATKCRTGQHVYRSRIHALDRKIAELHSQAQAHAAASAAASSSTPSSPTRGSSAAASRGNGTASASAQSATAHIVALSAQKIHLIQQGLSSTRATSGASVSHAEVNGVVDNILDLLQTGLDQSMSTSDSIRERQEHLENKMSHASDKRADELAALDKNETLLEEGVAKLTQRKAKLEAELAEVSTALESLMSIRTDLNKERHVISRDFDELDVALKREHGNTSKLAHSSEQAYLGLCEMRNLLRQLTDIRDRQVSGYTRASKGALQDAVIGYLRSVVAHCHNTATGLIVLRRQAVFCRDKLAVMSLEEDLPSLGMGDIAEVFLRSAAGLRRRLVQGMLQLHHSSKEVGLIKRRVQQVLSTLPPSLIRLAEVSSLIQDIASLTSKIRRTQAEIMEISSSHYSAYGAKFGSAAEPSFATTTGSLRQSRESFAPRDAFETPLPFPPHPGTAQGMYSMGDQSHFDYGAGPSRRGASTTSGIGMRGNDHAQPPPREMPSILRALDDSADGIVLPRDVLAEFGHGHEHPPAPTTHRVNRYTDVEMEREYDPYQTQVTQLDDTIFSDQLGMSIGDWDWDK